LGGSIPYAGRARGIILFQLAHALAQAGGIQLIDGKRTEATLRTSRLADQPCAAPSGGFGERQVHNLDELLIAGWN
jgi:hypothetical protein